MQITFNKLRHYAKNSVWAMAGLLIIQANWAQAESSDRDQPIDLEADSVQVDDAKQTSTYVGNVILKQGSLLIKADKLIVKEDKDGFQHSTSIGNPKSLGKTG